MQNIKPILFSTPMVQAILEDRKTVTRRVVRTPKGYSGFYICRRHDGSISEVIAHDEHERTERPDGSQRYINPPGQVDDILWVRETWLHNDSIEEPYAYKADYNEKGIKDLTGEWRPSIFMPKEACRIFLRIKNVSIEKIQDLSQEQAKLEGIHHPAPHRCEGWEDPLLNFQDCYICPFKNLWNKINGPRGFGWDVNPHVCVIEFEKCEKPEGWNK